MEKTITFSEQEINVLKQLIHFAVQARGMEVAEAAVVIIKKLDARPGFAPEIVNKGAG